MTPSRKGDGPTAGSQLALPGAPRFDRFGMHAEDCDCARCGLGYRPSKDERRIAELHHARAEQRRREEEAKRAKGEAPPVAPAEVRHQRAHEREVARLKSAREYIEKMTAPVVRPATDEEMNELRIANGLRPKRGHGQ